ncbi:hypothetical protein GJ496_005482 [Pomphorhynchus laevis]|nr:hypothetical protein GJ496_005482 [Pomphorhynchus laevis]
MMLTDEQKMKKNSSQNKFGFDINLTYAAVCNSLSTLQHDQKTFSKQSTNNNQPRPTRASILRQAYIRKEVNKPKTTYGTHSIKEMDNFNTTAEHKLWTPSSTCRIPRYCKGTVSIKQTITANQPESRKHQDYNVDGHSKSIRKDDSSSISSSGRKKKLKVLPYQSHGGNIKIFSEKLNFNHIKPKVESLVNVNHKPRGGNVKVYIRSLFQVYLIKL